jgi:protein-disulfide isomerase
MPACLEALVGTTVLGDLKLEALVRADAALATFAARRVADSSEHTVRVALALEAPAGRLPQVETAAGRAARHALGIRGLAPPVAAGLVDVDGVSRLAMAHAGPARESAEARIGSGTPLGPAQVAAALEPVADALAALHAQGLVHGAVHPGAVHLGSSAGATLSAFGLSEIALALGGAQGARDVVPPRSRTPEQVGIVPAAPGPESDVYALGLLACELVIGRPFSSAEDPAVLARCTDHPITRPTPRGLSADVPDHVEQAFAAALRTRPSERTADPRQLLRSLVVPPAAPTGGAAAPRGPADERARRSDEAPFRSGDGFEPPPERRPKVRLQRSAFEPAPPSPGAPQDGAPSRAGRWLVAGVVALGLLLLLGGAGALFAIAVIRPTPAPAAPTTTPATATAPTALPTASVRPAPAPPPPSEDDEEDPSGGPDGGGAPPGASSAPQPKSQPVPSTAGGVSPDDTTALVPIGKDTPVLGPRDAPVTIVLFGDLQCPYTRRARVAIDKLLQQYGGDLRVAVRHLPLPMHDKAEAAAEMAASTHALAGAPAFWRFLQSATDNQSSWSDSALAGWSVAAGAPRAALERATREHAHKAVVDDDRNVAGRLMVRATPTFFVNGRRIDGMPSQSALSDAIDREMAAARAALLAGTPANKLYAARVLFNVTSAAADPRPPPGQRSRPAPRRP